jgi:hypothetical protein
VQRKIESSTSGLNSPLLSIEPYVISLIIQLVSAIKKRGTWLLEGISKTKQTSHERKKAAKLNTKCSK